MSPPYPLSLLDVAPPQAADIPREMAGDGGGLYALADTAAASLADQLQGPEVSIHQPIPGTTDTILLARVPRDSRSSEPAGTRGPAPGSVLRRAIGEGVTQHATDVYVAPDSVRGLASEIRSEVAVPVSGAEGPVGAVHLVYRGAEVPAESHVTLAEALALRLAPAFLAATKVAAADPVAPAATRLAAILSCSDDLDAAGACVAEAALELTGATGALLLVRRDGRQDLRVIGGAGSLPALPGGTVPVEDTLIGEVARSGVPRCWLRADDAAATAVFGPWIPNPDTALAVPLRSAGRTFGALVVVNRDAGGRHAPEEAERLDRLARHAASIGPLSQLGPLRRKLSDSSLIAEVGRAVTGTLGRDEVLLIIVRAAEMLVAAHGVALGLLSEDGDHLDLVAAGGTLHGGEGQKIPVAGSLMGWSVATASLAVSESVSDDPRGFAHPRKHGPGVVVPLESRARVSGALLVTRAEGAPPPSEEDIDALRKLASYASIAIDNADLYSEQIELSRVLQARTDELVQACADLEESQERLVVTEKLAALGRITAGIAHEINSPLGGILNALQLASGYAEEYRASAGDPEVTAHDHATIARDLTAAIGMAEIATRKVAEFVRTIKAQTRTGEECAHTEFAVASEAEAATTFLAQEFRDSGAVLRFDVDPQLTLVGDRARFSLIVRNLVGNAIDAYEGEPGEVVVSARREEGALLLTIADQGCGIPEAIRPKIFDYLFTTKEMGKGTGLGLSIVHSLVTTSFRGEISVDSEAGSGTRFNLRFPDRRLPQIVPA